MPFPFLRGVKELNCKRCLQKYPISEFYEIAKEVGENGIGYPPFIDLLQCLKCWRIKYPKTQKER